MARPIDPDDPGTGGPGDPGYTPPASPGTALAAITTNSNYTFTGEEITAAGGPWTSFTLRVTPINDNGVGTAQEYDYPPPP